MGTHADKVKRKKATPKPAIGAGSFFDTHDALTSKVEMFNAQIKPLEESREGAADDVTELLRQTNIEKYLNKALHELLESDIEAMQRSGSTSREFKKLMDLYEDEEGYGADKILKEVVEKKLYANKVFIDENGNLQAPGYYLFDEKGRTFFASIPAIDYVITCLEELGIDKNKIRKQFDKEQKTGRPYVFCKVTLDADVIQAMINKEADRRFNLLPEVASAKKHIKGLTESVKKLGSKDTDCGQFEILKRAAGHTYDKIAERVHAEILGKARFKKFDGGDGLGDDKQPDAPPSTSDRQPIPSVTGGSGIQR